LKRLLVHILVVLALITAGISPACKFIKGASATTLIEICTLQGIKHVAVPAAQDQEDEPSREHRVADLCQFCFNSSNIKVSAAPAPLLFAAADISSSTFITSRDDEHSEANLTAYAPRGPPTFL